MTKDVCDHEWESGYDILCPDICKKCGRFDYPGGDVND